MLGIIINPKSGKRYFRAQRVYLWRLLRQRHLPFTYRLTKYASHAIELGRELVEKGYDEILVLGGDGTLSEVVNGIMRANITPEQRQKIQIGLMPRGTGNDFGRYWKLDKNFRKSLDRFFSGTPHPLDVGCVTYWRNGIEHHRYFINSVGFGIDSLTTSMAEVLKYYMGSHHVNYTIALILALFKHKSTRMLLDIDGQQQIDGQLFTMNIGNGPYSGGGIRQNPDANPSDGVFHAMFVAQPTVKQMILAIRNLFNGRITDLPFVHSIIGKDILIQTKKHIRFEADGIMEDIMGPCEVHCLPHCLNMCIADLD